MASVSIMCTFCSDIRKIIPADILPDSLAGGIARVSNLKNSKVVTAPSGKKVNIMSPIAMTVVAQMVSMLLIV